MRFVRFQHSQGIHYGLLKDKKVQIWTRAPWSDGKPLDDIISVNDIELLPPCQPGKVVATAINYPGATGLTEKTNEPLVFIKPSSSVIGPEKTIISPFIDAPVWGECELGIVIGKKLSKATVEEASTAIFGYTIGNDVSCENVFGWDHHLARSKGADTFCVLGPWIDTDFDPNGKYISGYHNDNLLREGYCEQRLWKEPELLVWLSSWMTLEPGDVILTGAPTRVCERIYFKDGDRFTCIIEGLGELSNPFEQL
jgi:2-keto-4-pentenoate hydratase/2-oxohepta-3-ene-1,7-dioic acid hydratase in catechol pathway